MLFADDPAAYFAHDGHAAHMLDPAEREALQQQALGYRLEQLLPQLPPLALLAHEQQLDAAITFDDAPRLFYPHSIYKSYDPQWLAERDFARMTAWANLLVTRDLSSSPGQDFATIDDWLGWLEAEHALDVGHSSGTTGRMSFVFRDNAETQRRFQRIDMQRRDWYRSHGLDQDESQMRVIWPGPGKGRSAIQKVVSHWYDGLDDPAQVMSLYESDLGADFELHVAAVRLARESGGEAPPAANAHVAAMLAEAERRHQDREHYLDTLFDKIEANAKGERIVLLGGPLGIYAIAVEGARRGLSGSFAPQSLSCRLGGLKGMPQPDGMEEAIGTFLGTDHTMHGYGMTELNAGFLSCEAGHFHVPPWIVPYVLDENAGGKAKPRTGKQSGRAAFLDIATQANWGGLVTADFVTVDYGACSCGRASPTIQSGVDRIADKDGDVNFVPASDAAMNGMLDLMKTIT